MKIDKLSYQHQKNGPYFFKDLTFELEEGRLHALHGKNGVGKSVLLHLLSRKFEKDAIFMHQKYDQTLASNFSFLENLQFATLEKFPSPFSRLKKPSLLHFDLLEKFHIDPSLPIDQLSGGQRQIIALLMHLQRDTKIFLLDEPTAALDEQNAMMVFEFLKSLQGITMIIVCHDQELLKRYTTGKHLHLTQIDGLRQLDEIF